MGQKKIKFFFLIGVFLFTFGSHSVFAKKITLKVATSLPANSPTGIATRYIAELATKVAGDQLDAKAYTSGAVGGDAEIAESVSLGTIQMMVGTLGSLSTYIPEYSIFDLPYLFEDMDHVQRVFWGPGGEAIAAEALRKGFRILAFYDAGFQGFYNSKRSIKSIRDMKGLKMRVMKIPNRIKVMNSFGAGAVPVSWPEFYGAMETGVVDGGENPYDTYNVGAHYEVAKYYTESNHNFLVGQIMVSEKFYKSLPLRLKVIIGDLARMGSHRHRSEYLPRNIKAKEIVQAKGSIVNVLPKSERAKFLKAAQPVYDEYVKQFGSDLLNQIEMLKKSD